jgi:formate dehydrogenase iron-sulfur subunit
MSKSILFDSTLCIGCGACRDACKVRNGLPPGEEKELNYNAVNVVQDYKIDGNVVYTRKFCMHCVDPTCVSVCPVGAFQKTQIGAVIYDKDKCMGCRYCMVACPFQVPRYEWFNAFPVVKKCDMCYDRISNGGVSACVEACPTGASTMGDRDELIKLAHEKMAGESKKMYLYGEKEVGGTQTLILTDISPDKLGFPMNLPKEPLPLLTWNALSKVPTVVLTGGTLLSGIWWITHRRKDVEEFERKMKSNNSNQERK